MPEFVFQKFNPAVMKTTIILFFLCLVINANVIAQTTTTKKASTPTSSVQLGIKAGVNISNIHYQDGEYDSRTGFHAGGLAHIHINENFAVQPEITYSSQGAEDESNAVKLKYNYINVPVLLQLMTNNGFRLQTGPQLCLLVSSKLKRYDLETDTRDQMNTAGFAWSFGASYLSKAGLGLDVRYNLGLSTISDEAVFAPESKNRVWQIGAFYQFSH